MKDLDGTTLPGILKYVEYSLHLSKLATLRVNHDRGCTWSHQRGSRGHAPSHRPTTLLRKGYVGLQHGAGPCRHWSCGSQPANRKRPAPASPICGDYGARPSGVMPALPPDESRNQLAGSHVSLHL